MATPRGALKQTGLTKAEAQAAMKEALKEWLDEKLAVVGVWTLRGLAALGLTALAFILIISSGWGNK